MLHVFVQTAASKQSNEVITIHEWLFE